MLSFFFSTLFNLLLYYCLATGIAFTILAINSRLKDVQKRTPLRKDYIREVKHSLLSLIVFTTVSTILYQTRVLNYTTLYYDINERGWFYYFAIIPVMFLIQDLFFYISHITMHHKKIFNLVHLVHHKSKHVSPLSALSMHPIEAILSHGPLIILFFLFPIHVSHVYIWVSVTLLHIAYLHLGIELYNRKFLQTKIGKYIYTATAHSDHHVKFKGNYGFYTTIWDRLFKTIRL